MNGTAFKNQGEANIKPIQFMNSTNKNPGHLERKQLPLFLNYFCNSSLISFVC